MKFKYITYNDSVIDTILVFPQYTYHRDITIHGKILGAGFIEIVNNTWNCYGESISLGVKSRPEDTRIANTLLSFKE